MIRKWLEGEPSAIKNVLKQGFEIFQITFGQAIYMDEPYFGENKNMFSFKHLYR